MPRGTLFMGKGGGPNLMLSLWNKLHSTYSQQIKEKLPHRGEARGLES